MQPRIRSCVYSLAAGLTLALFGLAGIPSGTGEAQAATQLTAQPIIAQAPEAIAPTLVRRGASDKRCTRAADNSCTKDYAPKPLPRPQ